MNNCQLLAKSGGSCSNRLCSFCVIHDSEVCVDMQVQRHHKKTQRQTFGEKP